MVPFAGYEMPVQYPTASWPSTAIPAAPPACSTSRTWGSCAWWVRTPQALLETLVPVDIVDLPVFKQRYALFTNEAGGILDDLMV
jgi:aminomethyltransferase